MEKKPNQVVIGGIPINSFVRPKIIAELGINHNGSLDLAKKMSELAVEAGADFVKTQMHIPKAEMSESAKKLVPSHCNESIFEIMEQASLSVDEEYELKEFIESIGSQYLCTPFSVEAADILGRDFGVNAFKIGSGECNNDYVLNAAASFNKPMIVSTGMNDLKTCAKTYDLLLSQIGCNVILMHTTNIYPTPSNLVRLGGVTELQSIAGLHGVGLSDHTVNNNACLGAVALGAVLLERHFTDSKDREGPDISNSMDANELRELRTMSYDMFLMRGGSKSSLIAEEDDTRDFAFATFVALKDISNGQSLDATNVAPKRPALGDYYARDEDKILGRKCISFISAGEHIMRSHLE